MTWVLKNTESGRFVARSGAPGSYTVFLQFARTWPDRAAAERERCPGNEVALTVEEAMAHG